MNLPDEPTYSVNDSNVTFEVVAQKPYVPEDLRSAIEFASLVIVPREGFRDEGGPLFPAGTLQLLDHINDAAPELVVAVPVSDEDYRELSLHDAQLTLGTFLLTLIAAPIFVNLVTEFIKKKTGGNEQTAKVDLIMNVRKPNGHTTEISYKGPAVYFESSIAPILKSMAEVTVADEESVATESSVEERMQYLELDERL
jgi:hypothetical protein